MYMIFILLCLCKTTSGQSGPGSNGLEAAAAHSSDLQKWSFITRCTLVQYLRRPFYEEESDPSTGDTVAALYGPPTRILC